MSDTHTACKSTLRVDKLMESYRFLSNLLFMILYPDSDKRKNNDELTLQRTSMTISSWKGAPINIGSTLTSC
jgi:hypothetical protein